MATPRIATDAVLGLGRRRFVDRLRTNIKWAMWATAAWAVGMTWALWATAAWTLNVK